MKGPFGKNVGTSGFSLVELMIVVGIIGILAAMAIPRFQKFQAKAKMAEARTMLNHIYTLQEAYHLENNIYLATDAAGRSLTNTSTCNQDFDTLRQLGLTFEPCDQTVPRYNYQVTLTAGEENSAFDAIARTGEGNANLVCNGQPGHQWTMDESRNLLFAFTAAPTTSTTPRCEPSN